MELIPILSLIILVATISTFILAVGAYILFKVRERKGKVAQAPQPAAVAGEMITPAQQAVAEQPAATRATYTEERYATRESAPYQQPMYATGEGRMKAGPNLRPTYASPATQTRYTQGATEVRNTGEGRPYSETGAKFMRYTNEGYAPPQKEEKRKDDSLKWR
ncbi:MAG: hypothetical protein GXO87_04975 [Chlorobi bacterium]|nr:hypothetical protein [Chlorobiota bacterium]